MKFTRDQFDSASEASLIQYLETNHHLSFRREGNRWFRCKEIDSLVIGTDNQWHYNSRGLHGSLPQFYLTKVLDMTLPDAVHALNGESIISVYEHPAYEKKEERDIGNIILPPKYKSCNQVYRYLTEIRGIDSEIVDAFVAIGNIYEEDGKYHNAVFVGGTGEDGKPRLVSKRSCGGRFFYDDANNDYDYPFSFEGSGNSLVVAEGAIDLLSAATLIKLQGNDWTYYSYIAELGASKCGIFAYLKRNPHINTAFIFMDNDQAGEQYAKREIPKLKELGYDALRIRPKGKDPNDHLLGCLEQNIELEGCI